MSGIRRLDHVGIAVRDTDAVVRELSDRLGLDVVSTEELESPRVRLTYLDVGNAFIQLVEPLDGTSEVARHLDEAGEGLHHICFGVDSVTDTAAAIADVTPADVTLGSGRGRQSAFVPRFAPAGVRLECTEFVRGEDADERLGFLP